MNESLTLSRHDVDKAVDMWPCRKQKERQRMQMWLRFTAILIAAGMAWFVVVFPSLIVQYLVPVADTWFHQLNVHQQEWVLIVVRWVLPAITGVCSLILMISNILTMWRQRREKTSFSDKLS